MTELRVSIDAIAHVCHDANRAIQLETGDPSPSRPWEDAAEWERAAAVTGVQAALNGETPEALHQSWIDFKVADGWTYGPVKDGEKKTHPSLVPYDQLPEDEKTKDYLFYGIVNALTRQTEKV